MKNTTITVVIPENTKTYTISFDNIDALEEKFERVNKRAKKLLQPEIQMIVHGYEQETDEKTGEVFYSHIISVNGSSPKINGYTFIAKIDHLVTDAGEQENILHSVPGNEEISLKNYRTVDAQCDHCHINRNRNSTYLLQSEIGTMKQVGSTCLKDFLGYRSPEALAEMAELLFSLHEECAYGEEDERAPSKKFADVKRFLSYVVASIEKNGWLSKAQAEIQFSMSTTASVLKEMDDRYSTLKPTEKQKEKAVLAIDWMKAKNVDDLNDFDFQLHTLVKSAFIEKKYCGYLACLINSYDRYVQKTIENGKKVTTSTHQGIVGEKIIRTLTTSRIIEIESMYGVSSLHLMTDKEGNCYTWFSSNKKLEIGQEYTLIGTVKEHNERDGVKQTQLKLCKEYVEKTTRKKK